MGIRLWPHANTAFLISHQWTPLVSGHSVMASGTFKPTFLTLHKWTVLLLGQSIMVPATYEHYVLNLSAVDNSPTRTFCHGPNHVQTLHEHYVLNLSSVDNSPTRTFCHVPNHVQTPHFLTSHKWTPLRSGQLNLVPRVSTF